MARTAEVIWLGDEEQLVKSAQAVLAAVEKSASGISDANDQIGESYGRTLEAAQKAADGAAKASALAGGSLDDQAKAAEDAANAVMGAYGRMDEAAIQQAESARAQSAAIGGTLDDQIAAYDKTADAALAAAEEQKAAMAEMTEAAETAAAAQAEAMDAAGATIAGFGKKALEVVGAAAAGALVLGIKLEDATTKVANAGDTSEAAAKKITDAFGEIAGAENDASALGSAYAGIAGELKVVEGHALGTAAAVKVMTAAEDLSRASGEKLEPVTDSLGKVMLTYDENADHAAETSDILYEATKATSTGVSELESTVDKLHGRLGALAPSLSESAGFLDELSREGVQGRLTMTALSGTFNTLLGTGTETQAMVKELGLDLYDSQGKFVGLKDVIDQLQPKMAGLSQESQIEATHALFGATANKQLLDIILQGPAAFEEATAAVSKHGSAQEAAAKQGETLDGEFKALIASGEDLGETIGEHEIPPLKDLVIVTKDAAEWLKKHETAAIALGAVITGVLGVAVLDYAWAKAVLFVSATKDMAEGLAAMAEKAIAAAGSITGVGEASEAATPEVAGLGAAFTAALPEIVAVGAAVLAVKKDLETPIHKGGVLSDIEGFMTAGLIGNPSASPIGLFRQGVLGEGEATTAPSDSGAASNHRGAYAPAGGAVTRWTKLAEEASAKYGIPANVLLAEIEQESGGTPIHSTGSSPGIGNLTQFLPSTASEYGVKLGSTEEDIRSQVMGQAAYLKALGGQTNIKAALEGYNSGTIGDSVSEGYANSILGKAVQFHTGGSPSSVGTLGSRTLPSQATLDAPVEAEKKRIKEEGEVALGLKAKVGSSSSSSSSSKETTAEREAKERAKEQAKALVALEKEAKRELDSILGAIHAGGLKELDSALKGVHERGLKELEHDLDDTHNKKLKELDSHLVQVHKQGLAALDTAIVKEWKQALGEIAKEVTSAVATSVATWEKATEAATRDKAKAALLGIEQGPEAELRSETEGGEAREATATERSNARALLEAQKKLKEAKWTGNKEEIEKAKEALTQAEEAVTNFARNQDEKRKSKKIETEKSAITQTQTAEETSLEARAKEYEASMLQRTKALEAQLKAQKISVEKFVKEIDGITGVVISVSSSQAGTIASGPSAPSGSGWTQEEGGAVRVGGAPVSIYGYEQEQGGAVRVGHASGGGVYPGVSYTVGETGPEGFTPSVPGVVTPASRTPAHAGGTAPLVKVDGPQHFHNRMDMDRFAHKLAHKLKYGGRPGA